MSARVGSAFVALTAAAVLAVASLPVGHLIGVHSISSWWSGAPTIGKSESHLLQLHIGLIRSAGCNVDRSGDVRSCDGVGEGVRCGCQGVPLTTGFRITKYVAFALTMVLLIGLIGFALTAFRNSPRRMWFAKVVLVAAAGAAIVAIVLLAMGPSFVGVEVDAVPFGSGLILFFIGGGMSIVAALLGVRSPSDRVIRPPRPSAVPTGPAGFDLPPLRNEPIRPSIPSLPQVPAMRPGGSLPGVAGPLVPANAQLRPLYEVMPSPPIPSLGVPVMQQPSAPPFSLPSLEPPVAPLASPPVPPQFTRPAPPMPPPQPPQPQPPPPPAAIAKTLPPPIRNKPTSVAPPIPPIPPRAKPPTGAPTMMGAAVTPPPPIPPPPAVRPSRPPSEPDTVNFEKQPDTQTVTETGDQPFDGHTATDSQPIGLEATLLSHSSDIAPPARGSNSNATPRPSGRAARVSAAVLGVGPTRPTRTTPPSPSPTAAAVDPMAITGTDEVAPPPPPQPADPMGITGTGQLPLTTASQSLPPPREIDVQTTAGPSPGCPQCESPMAWIEEHLRFYCKSCRMYF